MSPIAKTQSIPIVTSFETMPEMSEISPCVSNTSAECDASNTSTSEDDLTTPPQSPPSKSTSVPSSEWITKDPKTGLPRYNFPSLNKKKPTTPSPVIKPSTDFSTPPMSDDWISHDPSSGKIRYNFPSLNKRPKAPPSPGPKFDNDVASIPSPPPSPAKRSDNTYLNSTSPYTRPGATLAVTGIRTGEPQRPASPTPLMSSKPASPPKSDRPQVSMPKSQPLSRMLFSKLSENTPGAPPSIIRKSSKPQKLIVPTKSFQTVFELPLTSSEFARRL